MEKEILIKDISVEWNDRKVRGCGTKQEAERFTKCICKKITPNLNYSTYNIANVESFKNKVCNPNHLRNSELLNL